MTELKNKFRKSIGILTSAADRSIELDYSQPKLYKKVVKFYQEQGVQFTGDSVEDYQIVIDCLNADIYAETV